MLGYELSGVAGESCISLNDPEHCKNWQELQCKYCTVRSYLIHIQAIHYILLGT